MHTLLLKRRSDSTHTSLNMGPTGFDGEIKSNASMRGVVSSTSLNKLSQNVIGRNCHSQANTNVIPLRHMPSAAVAA